MGGYVVMDTPHPKVVLVANGSEVSLLCEVATLLEAGEIPCRVVSVPSIGLFESQERFEMFRDHSFEIMYMNRRIAYFKSYTEQKPSLNPPFSSVYLCKGMLPKQICFEEINKKAS